MKLKPINQQVVVVMGASSGIGRVTALRFAEKGAKVVVAARNQKGLDAVVAEIERKGGEALAIVADTARVEEVKRVAERAVARFGRIDTWAHVAGVGLWSPFEMTKPEEMERLIEVNLLGQMYGALAALPHLRAEGRGALIHVSSIEGKISFPWSSAYAASKHGMVGFLDALRLELEREGMPIAVVNVMPAAIDTPIFRNALTRLGVQPRGASPMYAPEIVAEAILAAAQNPVREVSVGGAGGLLIKLQRHAPRLAQQLLLTPLGFEAQLTRIPKSEDAPNNLFAPTPDEHLSIHGGMHRDEVKTSLYTRLGISAPARIARDATRPVLALVARAIEMLWAARFGKQLRGIKTHSGLGAGLPEVVLRQMAQAGIVQILKGERLHMAQGVKLEHGTQAQGVKLEHGAQAQSIEIEVQGLKLEREQEAKPQKSQAVRRAKAHAQRAKGKGLQRAKGQGRLGRRARQSER
ncbi:MAG: SDR family oxidoreductase [Minicystis sp.]